MPSNPPGKPVGELEPGAAPGGDDRETSWKATGRGDHFPHAGGGRRSTLISRISEISSDASASLHSSSHRCTSHAANHLQPTSRWMFAVPDTQPGRQRTPAERMRRSRQRRREGTRVVPVEIRDPEISGLVAHGLLDPAARTNRDAIATALGALLDRYQSHRGGGYAVTRSRMTRNRAPRNLP